MTAILVVTYTAIAVFGSGLLPHAEGTTWTAFLPGALVFALGIEALRLFSALFLAPRLAVTPELYGALGLASVYLLWLYLLARCVVACAFTNATLWTRAHPTIDTASSAGPFVAVEAPPLGVEPDPETVERPQP